jgi:ATP-dependent Lon protease
VKKETVFRVSVVGLLAAILVVQMMILNRKSVPQKATQTSTVKPLELFQKKTNIFDQFDAPAARPTPDWATLKPIKPKTFSFEEAQQLKIEKDAEQMEIVDAFLNSQFTTPRIQQLWAAQSRTDQLQIIATVTAVQKAQLEIWQREQSYQLSNKVLDETQRQLEKSYQEYLQREQVDALERQANALEDIDWDLQKPK